jgi:hypothetical protein
MDTSPANPVPLTWDTSKRKRMLRVIPLAIVHKGDLLLVNELSLTFPETGSPKEKSYRKGDQQ